MFFVPVLKISSGTMFIMVIMIFMQKPWKLSRIVSKAILILIPPRNPIIVTTKAMPLVIQNPLSSIMIVAVMLQLPPIHHLVVLETNLAIVFALVTNMMPVCHIFATAVASAKTSMQSNGLFVRCIIPPLVPKLPRTLMHYEKQQTHQNTPSLYYVKLLFQFAATLQS